MTMCETLSFDQLGRTGLSGLSRPTRVTGIDHSALGDPAFRDWLSDRQMPVVNNYLDDLTGGRDPGGDARGMTLRDYLETPATPGDRRLEMVLEAPVPPELLARIAVPDALLPLRIPRLFAGRAGCWADMHFDWMSHWLFQTPLFGAKHFVFLPAAAGPVLDARSNLSQRDLRGLDMHGWSALTAELGGCHVVLEPGQGLLQPPFWWHAVQYLEPAASVSIGVGAVDPVIDAIVAAPGPRDWKLAALFAARIARDGSPDPSDRLIDALHTRALRTPA